VTLLADSNPDLPRRASLRSINRVIAR